MRRPPEDALDPGRRMVDLKSLAQDLGIAVTSGVPQIELVMRAGDIRVGQAAVDVKLIEQNRLVKSHHQQRRALEMSRKRSGQAFLSG